MARNDRYGCGSVFHQCPEKMSNSSRVPGQAEQAGCWTIGSDHQSRTGFSHRVLGLACVQRTMDAKQATKELEKQLVTCAELATWKDCSSLSRGSHWLRKPKMVDGKRE
jgi:hypothetical protein